MPPGLAFAVQFSAPGIPVPVRINETRSDPHARVAGIDLSLQGHVPALRGTVQVTLGAEDAPRTEAVPALQRHPISMCDVVHGGFNQ